MSDELKTDLETIAIDKRPVGCLAGASFRIPKYQRGYRWKKDDVTKLLEDLAEFIEEGKAAAITTETAKAVRSFYCLQPLVVTKSDEHPSEWEVVDGQQRLTTLFLIWNVLNGEAPYGLSYETRGHSAEFLKKPFPPNQNEKDEKRHPNIDFHHIYLAQKTIVDWFDSQKHLKADFAERLSDCNPEGRNVRFIWYQLEEGDDAVAAFTRLNVGKIPLTDEELIRALFLSSNKSGQVADQAFQHRLALEWDRMEALLQEPDFWGFLSNETPPEGGRIRLLFQLCTSEEVKDDNHALFDYYQDRLAGKQREEPSKVWKEIIACFEQLEEWYRDPELFHLIGYRTTVLNPKRKSEEILRGLFKEAKKSNKPDFANYLRIKIRDELIKGGKKLADFIDELDYKLNVGPIRPTLALFNIATILRTKGVRIRFPFHLYHGNDWDIEHVHSQAGQDLSKGKHQQEWLPHCIEEIRWEDPQNTLIQSISAFITMQPDVLTFENLHKKIAAFFGESENTPGSQGIGNLTLLDQATNRAYGNAPFVVKRGEILKAERKGTFILPCTRDLFLKVYSKNAGNLRRWDIASDGSAHKAAICENLESFFGEEGGTK